MLNKCLLMKSRRKSGLTDSEPPRLSHLGPMNLERWPMAGWASGKGKGQAGPIQRPRRPPAAPAKAVAGEHVMPTYGHKRPPHAAGPEETGRLVAEQGSVAGSGERGWRTVPCGGVADRCTTRRALGSEEMGPERGWLVAAHSQPGPSWEVPSQVLTSRV